MENTEWSLVHGNKTLYYGKFNIIKQKMPCVITLPNIMKGVEKKKLKVIP